MVDRVLALPVADALRVLCTGEVVIHVVPVAPPEGVTVGPWRVARVVKEADGSLSVTAVAQIEGTTGCSEPLEQN